MKQVLEADYFMKDEIKKIDQQFHITMLQICKVTKISEESIVADQLSDEQRQRLFSFVSGCMILDWKVKGNDVLSGLIQHLLHEYGFEKETLAQAAYISIEELEACIRQEPLSQTDAYQVFSYLFRLHNIVVQSDPEIGHKVSM